MSCSLNMNKRALLESGILYGKAQANQLRYSLHRLLQTPYRFDSDHGRQRHEYNRKANSASCTHENRLGAQSAPTMIHYIGPTKPWTPYHVKLKAYKKKLEAHWTITDVLDRFWWLEYLSDKTVVVGAGPSLRHPLGIYIDFCRTVVRVNNFILSGETGLKVTHAVVHKATQQAKGMLDNLPPEKILLSGFGEDERVIDERMAKRNGIRLQISRGDLTVLPDYYHTTLNDEVGIPRDRHALTGTIAVAWALKNTRERPIFVVGLDMAWQNTENISYSHGDGSQTNVASLAKYHKIEADAQWLQSLERRGEIVRLDKLGFRRNS